MGIRYAIRLALGVAILAVFVFAAMEAMHYSRLARYMPLYVSAAGIVFSLLSIGVDLWRLRTARALRTTAAIVAPEDFEAPGRLSQGEEMQRIRLAMYYLLWVLGYVALIGIVGLPVATAIFLGLFLAIEARMRILGTAVGIGLVLLALLALTRLVNLRWPPSLIGW
jgi:hypothetical protein